MRRSPDLEIRIVATEICISPRGLSCRNASFFECFPYVCPEPVLVKRSFLYINGAKGRVSLRICEANVLLLGAFAWLWWCWRSRWPWRCWGGG